jgi:hypothetical protein
LFVTKLPGTVERLTEFLLSLKINTNSSHVLDVALKGYALLKWGDGGREEESRNGDHFWPVPLLGCGLDSTSSRRGPAESTCERGN